VSLETDDNEKPLEQVLKQRVVMTNLESIFNSANEEPKKRAELDSRKKIAEVEGEVELNSVYR
jgi:hypothetical protein